MSGIDLVFDKAVIRITQCATESRLATEMGAIVADSAEMFAGSR
jgi:hypothetical protein